MEPVHFSINTFQMLNPPAADEDTFYKQHFHPGMRLHLDALRMLRDLRNGVVAIWEKARRRSISPAAGLVVNSHQ